MNDSKEMLTGGDILVQCLLEENVQYLFGIIGGELMAMFDAVYRWGRESGINTVMFRHEQAAAHAADAWARVTNTPGVCFGTVGPGALHLVPAVGTAWSDNIPMIVIVPQKNKMIDDSFALQGNVDQIGIFKPITKYQRTVRTIERIPDAVHKAFRETTGGRPQPVILELTTDATFAKIDVDDIKHQVRTPSTYRAEHYPAPPDEAVTQALKLLKSAKKPLIVSGGGVMRSEAWDELREFAEHMEIPVVTSIMGIGTMSTDSKCFVLQAGPEADVVLALGCKFSHTMGLGQPPRFRDSQKLIHVDIDPSTIGRRNKWV
ncbi:unnamed protein product [marine sediment metagenome]|uniref:Thiamine pyrophosphate-binding protein n=1 Tax=marine sediment metagenome TaxID=412755 RepID=X1AN50_9ZZZZ